MIRSKNNNLEERVKRFFVRSVMLCKKIPVNPITKRPMEQLSASSGSTAANYCEAQGAMSRRDFVKSIKVSRKEAKESIVWLIGLKAAVDFEDPEFDPLIQEAKELTNILTSILEKTDKK